MLLPWCGFRLDVGSALMWVQPALTHLSGLWRHPEVIDDYRGMWAHPKAAPGTQTSPQEAEEMR